jgi:UDP-2-acetamido-2-deoxy-ribo-hexuluronate aminotransferase
MAIGVRKNDEVIIPAFSYIATAEAVMLLGAKPVFVDINPLTYNLDFRQIEKKINERTKAIIPVSLFGQPADFFEINEICLKYDIKVIEDGAQSFGAEYNGKKSCNLSLIGCTSFFPSKPLGCYGDGGAIFTSDPDLSKKIRQIGRHGQERRYYHVKLGLNSRLDTIQAAILLQKLDLLDQEISERKLVAEKYDNAFRNLRNITIPHIKTGINSAWAQYTIALKDFDREVFRDVLSHNGISSAIHYPLPLPQQPVINVKESYPESETAAKSVISLPIAGTMNSSDHDIIINVVKELVRKM